MPCQRLKEHSGADAITWIGHSTYLMRLGNKNILFDPFFSAVASPIPVGPERYVAPRDIAGEASPG